MSKRSIRTRCRNEKCKSEILIHPADQSTLNALTCSRCGDYLIECGNLEKENDPVNHPAHYTHPSGIECIEVTRHMNFNIGNAIKYLWRHGKKDPKATVQDLKKAAFYIQDEIGRLESPQRFEYTCMCGSLITTPYECPDLETCAACQRKTTKRTTP